MFLLLSTVHIRMFGGNSVLCLIWSFPIKAEIAMVRIPGVYCLRVGTQRMFEASHLSPVPELACFEAIRVNQFEKAIQWFNSSKQTTSFARSNRLKQSKDVSRFPPPPEDVTRVECTLHRRTVALFLFHVALSQLTLSRLIFSDGNVQCSRRLERISRASRWGPHSALKQCSVISSFRRS